MQALHLTPVTDVTDIQYIGNWQLTSADIKSDKLLGHGNDSCLLDWLPDLC